MAGWPRSSSGADLTSHPLISTIICTHNRAKCLARALDSVIAQDLPGEFFEIVVVDNGSTDGTRDVVARHAPRVRYVLEPAIGLSRARNTGWREARADFVALLDDDAEAEPGWLGAVLNAFTSVAPAPACVGGRVDPQWESPRPAWLSDKLLLSLTVADWTDIPHAITDLTSEWLVGANIAFRRDVLERLGGFPASLGRHGSRLLSGEEIYLQTLLIHEGRTCWYEPKARVRHRVPANRLSPSWFRRRYFAQGLSDAAMWRLARNGSSDSPLGLAARQAMPIVRSGFGLRGMLRAPDDADEFTDHCGVLWRLGYVAGLLRGA